MCYYILIGYMTKIDCGLYRKGTGSVMKVSITGESRKCLLVAELPAAKRLIAEMKEDTSTVAEYARMAMRTISSDSFEIYRPEAVVAKNNRVWNKYFEGSGTLDVYITFLAFNSYCGAYECGVYLSDIWELCEANYGALPHKMYINAFEKRRV